MDLDGLSETEPDVLPCVLNPEPTYPKPVPAQYVALELLHLRVKELPCIIVDGETVSDAVGGGVLTTTLAVSIAECP